MLMKKLVLAACLLVCLKATPQFCYNVASIAYNPDPFNGGTNLGVLVDDQFSGKINLPFQFCYDGVTYTKVLISTNGYLSFDLALANTYSDWQILSPIPTTNPNTIQNAILGPWVDLDVSISGNIFYATYGATPNRRFVVSFNNAAMYQCNAKKFTGQITLYETSYNIDIIINSKLTCPVANSWNGDLAVEGVHNAAGTAAFVVPGRNATIWGANQGPAVTNDAWRFTFCGVCTVLPIELVAFDGTAKDKYNLLTWSTATEKDNDYFIVERSDDAQHFTEVGRVKGNGNSNHLLNYSLKDYNLTNGITYYQLRAIDFNKKEQYSNVIAVENKFAEKKIVRVLNILGQDVNENYEGVKIIYYSDGSVIKQF
jgi:hypothetical protein